ncbi:MAG: hypothetical protein ACKO3W_00160 [bacterium]
MSTLLAVRGWEFGIGDPTVLGWSITAGYSIAAWLALRAAAAASGWHGREIKGVRIGEGILRFWILIALVMVVLGVNKQLDLQRLFTETAREIAKDGGWYRGRKPIQYAVLGALFLTSAALAGWMLWALRRHIRVIWPAVGGLIVLAAYVAMRGTSQHDVDVAMRSGPIPLRDSMELVGIAAIAWAAWRFVRPAVGTQRAA